MEILLSYDELAAWAAGHGRKQYVAVGFYDGVHLGHRYLLGELQAAAMRLGAQALALTFENSPKEFHSPEEDTTWKYLTLPHEKLHLLGQTGLDATLMVHYDASVAGQGAREFLRGLDRRAGLGGLCVGYDTSIGNDMVSGYQQFRTLTTELGLDLTYVEPLSLDGAPVKSQRIRSTLELGDVAAAAELLGHRYFFSGEVVRGKGKGLTELGIPTANVRIPPHKLMPPPGVYAGSVSLNGRTHPAALCISTDEQHWDTVLERNSEEQTSRNGIADPDAGGAVLEAAIAEFSGDLYGKELRVEFVTRLRGWQDFSSAAALAEQMRRDIADAVRLAGPVRAGED